MLLPLTDLGYLRLSLSYIVSDNGIYMYLYVDAVRLILHHTRNSHSLSPNRAYGLVSCSVIFSCSLSWVCFHFVSACSTIEGSVCWDSSHIGFVAASVCFYSALYWLRRLLLSLQDLCIGSLCCYFRLQYYLTTCAFTVCQAYSQGDLINKYSYQCNRPVVAFSSRFRCVLPSKSALQYCRSQQLTCTKLSAHPHVCSVIDECACTLTCLSSYRIVLYLHGYMHENAVMCDVVRSFVFLCWTS